MQEISGWLSGRKILLLAPGKSLVSHYDSILRFVEEEHPFVISVNFADTRYPIDACFVSNLKRMDTIGREIRRMGGLRTILPSNIAGGGGCVYVNYACYTNGDDMVSDNAGLMLLSLLKRCGAHTVYLAGFDGFHHRHGGNYYSEELNSQEDEGQVREKRKRIRKQLQELSAEMEITFITPSVYK